MRCIEHDHRLLNWVGEYGSEHFGYTVEDLWLLPEVRPSKNRQ